MGLSDPFQTTFEGARQGLGTFGQAINDISQLYARNQMTKAAEGREEQRDIKKEDRIFKRQEDLLGKRKQEQFDLLRQMGIITEENPSSDELQNVLKIQGKEHGFKAVDFNWSSDTDEDQKRQALIQVMNKFGIPKPQGKLVISPDKMKDLPAGMNLNMTTGETEFKSPSFMNLLQNQIPGIGNINNGDAVGFGTQVSGYNRFGPKYNVDTPADVFKRGSSLREEFINRPEVKDYVNINTNVRSMDSLLKSALEGNQKNKVALDQGLITMYNKLTDPSSVVRESEYARTPENLPLVNRFNGAFQKIEQGGAGLTDSDREALVWGAKVIANQRGATFNQALDAYKDLSGQAKVPEESVLRGFKHHQDYDFKGKGVQPSEAMESQSMGQGQTSKGTKWKRIGQ